MKKLAGLFLCGLILIGSIPASADEEVYQFLAEETKVVTASRLPQTASQAPATVYVVTSEQIKDSGVLSIPDALRMVPGVDVMQTGTGQYEVSIRGLNEPLSNRVLVMIDGRTVLNDYFDFVAWDALPINLEEIDRIEVVEGPASALYGTNAINGVINIITKKPEQINGGLIDYTGGERKTQMGTLLYGKKIGSLGYKMDAGVKFMNSFENAQQQVSAVQRANTQVNYSLSPETDFSLSGGVSNIDTQIDTGGEGIGRADGPTGYLRGDVRHDDTKLRFFWNKSEIGVHDYVALANPPLNFNTYDVTLDQTFTLPFENSMAVGANYRKDTASSGLFAPGVLAQDLWAVYAEDQWKPIEQVSVGASGRVDRHPETGILFSPRGSLIYDPVPEQVFKISAGTAYRNPTLLENYLALTQSFPNPGAPPLTNPPFTNVQNFLTGNTSLGPEKTAQIELSHNGDFGRLKTNASIFHYHLVHMISTGLPEFVGAIPPTIQTVTSFSNVGAADATGGQVGAEMTINSWLNSFANYTYQSVITEGVNPDGSPRHKVNGGVTAKSKGVTASLWADWVDKTTWLANAPGTSPFQYMTLSDYTLINAHLGYAFAGKLQGLEIGANGFNIANQRRAEVLPPQPGIGPGENGEIIGERWTGTISYRF